ncbi:MAG: hypothetical protein R3A79_08225 [Nannocystaceae bacterium]
MIDRLLRGSAKLRARVLNFLLQSSALALILLVCGDSLLAAVPLWVIAAQALHYGLIALTDIYEDDYPAGKKRSSYAALALFYVWSLSAGYYDNEFIRLHTFVVLMGSVLGGKIDTPSWKVVFWLYMATIVVYELLNLDLLRGGLPLLLYIAGAAGVVFLCERLSEINQKAWMLHTVLFTGWALLHGGYFQEGVLFIVGGLGYETVKVLFRVVAESDNEAAKRLLFS